MKSVQPSGPMIRAIMCVTASLLAGLALASPTRADQIAFDILFPGKIDGPLGLDVRAEARGETLYGPARQIRR